MTRNASAASRQLALDLGYRPAHGRDNFLIAPSNEEAVAWVDRWPDWPGPVFVLYGPAACGKTHLAAVWRDRADAACIAADELAGATDISALMRRGPHLLIDHADPWIGDRAAETTLFHLHNLAKELGKTILLTMRAAPAHLSFTLPDLASRLRAAPAAAIHAPDETLLGAVLIKMFSDRQLAVEPGVLDYILPRMDRSFAAARDLVSRADRLTLEEKRALSVPLMRRVLTEQASED